MVTPRDIAVLLSLARYAVLSRPQVQRLCFPTDADGRVARRRLQFLVDGKLIHRQQMLYCQPSGGTPASVYFPSRQGNEFLANHFDDERYLASPVIPMVPHHIPHWIALAETHIAFDTAVSRQQEVAMEGWINEFDVVNKDESAPEKRFSLYVLLQESPRLVCNPDAAFLLSLLGHKKVFYIEQDRNTSGARQVADSKSKGYEAMNTLKTHRKHFPATTVDTFSVLLVAPTPKRRETLREAFRNKPGASLWRFAAVDDLSPENLLHAPIFYPCSGEAASLIKKKEP